MRHRKRIEHHGVPLPSTHSRRLQSLSAGVRFSSHRLIPQPLSEAWDKINPPDNASRRQGRLGQRCHSAARGRFRARRSSEATAISHSMNKQRLYACEVRGRRHVERHQRELVTEALAAQPERRQSLMHSLRARSERSGGHRKDSDRAVARGFHAFHRPVPTLGIRGESDDVAFGHPLLEQRDVLHLRGVLAEQGGPQSLGVLRKPAFGVRAGGGDLLGGQSAKFGVPVRELPQRPGASAHEDGPVPGTASRQQGHNPRCSARLAAISARRCCAPKVILLLPCSSLMRSAPPSRNVPVRSPGSIRLAEVRPVDVTRAQGGDRRARRRRGRRADRRGRGVQVLVQRGEADATCWTDDFGSPS